MYDEFFRIEESEQYAFYRIPKLLFSNKRFWNLSADAKLLYGCLLYTSIIVLNDNNMSISENVGGMSRYLSGIRSNVKYNNLKRRVSESLSRIPVVGESLVRCV